MSYSTLKAIDFKAYKDGQELAWCDPTGLAIRWAVAHSLNDIRSIRLNDDDRKRIYAAVERYNEENAVNGIRVEFVSDLRGGLIE